MTIRHYRALPLDVPDHFDGYGNADAYGPRPMIFAGVFAQALLTGIIGTILVLNVNEPDGLRPMVVIGIIGCTVLVILMNLQRQIVAVAQGKAERVEGGLRPALTVIGAVVLAIVIGLVIY